ncbi:hypothetical protein L3049_17420 [Labilibaculum sp. DW002]|jgi:hypothetical protein|uniref:Adhesin domain-containing protein n=1 Tax=Paralabilibaculum antarcticum TaxID=2912572 RepID=A0ABT5VWS8_9BACT|nr:MULTISPECIES: hypothetical protein [unclassified Labilibaculum]MBI9059025.1 hypothetical protein [Labilibaculum sp.]MDE5419776.1 hypothetical protein [Labilibaculum sp. DW002]
MKSFKSKFSAFLLVLILGFTTNALAIDEYEKEIKEVFTASQGTEFSIVNKYGDIDIKNWDADSVSIVATITIETTSEEKAKSLFNNIDIKLNKVGNNISALTEMSHKFKTGKKFSIDYEIFMPEYVKLDVSNKFGNIYIKALRAKANINLSYGNLQGESFLYPEEKPVSTINLSYAKATVNECNRTKLTLKYSKMNIGTSKALVVVSRYSKLHLDNNETVIADSKYDAFNIVNTNTFLVSMGQYSDFKIENVNKNLELNLRYGNCKIDNVSKDFESIKVDNKYVASRIAIEEGANYSLNAETKYCGISYPDNAQVIQKIVDNSETSLKVIVGNSESPKAKVQINSQYGNVSLK